MKDLKYYVGTMIEIPRAALTADEVAKEAEFFSFGTNDLTQTTMGLSRDDYTKFSKQYEDLKIFKADPFAVLDQEGVGKLIEHAVEAGPQDAPDLEIGICGEHGGEPSSVEFCYRVGMNYVSCSPYRVPIARLAAAQAAIAARKATSDSEYSAHRIAILPRAWTVCWHCMAAPQPIRQSVVRSRSTSLFVLPLPATQTHLSQSTREQRRLLCPYLLGRNRRWTFTCALLPVRLAKQQRTETARFAGQLALYCVEKLTDVKLIEGPWHTAENHSRPQSCIAKVIPRSDLPFKTKS